MSNPVQDAIDSIPMLLERARVVGVLDSFGCHESVKFDDGSFACRLKTNGETVLTRWQADNWTHPACRN